LPKARQLFDAAYKTWADTAEKELVSATGQAGIAKGLGHRGDGPTSTFIWQPLKTAQRARGVSFGTSATPWVAAWNRVLETLAAAKALARGPKAAADGLRALHRLGSRPASDSPAGDLDVCCREIAGRSIGIARRLQFPPIDDEEPDEDVETWWNDAATLKGEVAAALAAAELLEAKERRASWDRWKEANLTPTTGIRKIFRYSREPKAWQPPEVAQVDGKMVADPTGALKAEAAKLKLLWGARDVEDDTDIGLEWMEPDDIMPATMLRDASLSFKRRTGLAGDRFHPRHVGLLRDGGVEAFALLLFVFEGLGVMPKQVRYLLINLFDKPDGGLRPIGQYCAFYRCWGRARRPVARKWESENDRPFFATGTNRGAADPIWRYSVRAQAKKALGQHFAIFGQDFRKFYETMKHHRLLPRAAQHGFSAVIARAAVNHTALRGT